MARFSKKNPKDNHDTLTHIESEFTTNYSSKGLRRHNRLAGFGKFFISFLVVALLAGLGAGGYYVLAGNPFTQGKEVSVTIPDGASSQEIGQILAQADVVADGPMFARYMRLTGLDNYQSGQYTFRTGAGFRPAAQKLVAGDQDNHSANQLTIPEGTTLDQVASILAKYTGKSEDEVLAFLDDDQFFSQAKAAYPELLAEVANQDQVRHRLEGYLFPATYNLTPDQDLADIVLTMIDRTDQVRLKYADDLAKSKLSFHEVLTLASLIEAEAPDLENRERIAGVFLNRLEIDMPIQSDISVLYANQTHSAYVTIEDTETDSPYNLYQNTGLGPGPFNNPGEEAIEAALNPIPSDDLYFVADLKTGKVYYSKDYESHSKLVDQYVSEENADL
ncbi:hypothetical protein AWM75_07215 [Aerococcus urinaehominis]|uniref:Endolytic murein transglycosylase n=1 Tax=Aerococcus urinaehominis TaxID=128944 RepID=A0A0X8FM05_9LACT|nr:endolytic transglycosylase MltG [Aerococcus urinaehominis]AMB99764.1 hypothetical protein AWM75_07215 [Aerococcus urinaehominis]SDM09877.1 UPF0755 protein [Aerococcus urinaehominis]